jgi:hypothetical protein
MHDHQAKQTSLTQTRNSGTPPVRTNLLQRKCACGGTPGPTGECEACRRKREAGMLQRSASHAGVTNTAPPIVHEVLRSPGRSLDAATRAFMEPRLGHDFSHVRVHHDGQADQSARAVQASAYTVGYNVVFANGQYRPETSEGRTLMAHELAHVVQQESAPPTSTLKLGAADSALERAADQAARGVATDPSRAPEMMLQRQPFPEDTRPPNLGPPVQELPLPPRCSIIRNNNGQWSWQCKGVPGIGSTPEIPLDPRDIPDRLRDLIPKGPGDTPGGGRQTFPWPPTPDTGLPPNWFEDLCKRSPNSPLCLPPMGDPKPGQPSPTETLTRPTGIFWTWDVPFEHDQPSSAGGAANGGLTGEGATSLDTIIFLLNQDPTMQVRLIGHTSEEGDATHNLELSRRRVQLVYQRLDAAGLSGRVVNPIQSDGKESGCTRVDFGMWACGESQATQGEVRAEERKVAVTFHRNPPLPSGPFRLTPPQFGRRRAE